MKQLKIIIDEKSSKKRIDKIIFDYCKENNIEITRTKIQELIKNDFLNKNNEIIKNVSHETKLNEVYIFNIPQEEKEELKAKNIPLDIVYEDKDLIILNKQAGLTTHPGAGNNEDTLVNALINIYGTNLSKIGGDFRLGIVHRLDKNTSGLMVVAKNDTAHINLSEQLQNRDLKRNYKAFLWGVLNPKKGKIECFMDRSKTNPLKMEVKQEGRYSLTNYETLETFCDDFISLVDFNLDTGRTHQIRLHTSFKNCPTIGDNLYGGKSRHLKNEYNIKNFVDNFDRQALHSYKIKLFQPTTKKILEFKTDFPEDMKELYNKLKNYNKN